jgi:hypothetical protein
VVRRAYLFNASSNFSHFLLDVVNNGTATLLVNETLANCSAVAAARPYGRRNTSASLQLGPGDAVLLAYDVRPGATAAAVTLSVSAGSSWDNTTVALAAANFPPYPSPPPPPQSPAPPRSAEPSRQAQLALVLFGLGFAAIAALVARHRYQASVESAGVAARAYERIGSDADGAAVAQEEGSPLPPRPVSPPSGRPPLMLAKPPHAGLQLGAIRGAHARAGGAPAAGLVLGAGTVVTSPEQAADSGAAGTAAAARAPPATQPPGWNAAAWDDEDGADSGWDISDHSLLGSDEEVGSPIAAGAAKHAHG